ncbi:AfsR/SARP family transcriptional regulator [Micromonospora sp. NPDC049891]|uniref:AfsR/SARP family transcriptional regulator n=1 Tax=Micromonospora sp. NPDC049891 TaxID=3155655 RepID=UPI003401F0CB
MTGEAKVDFKILGPVAVRSGDEFIPISGPRHRRILATLLVDPERPVSTSRLVEVLWGEGPPSTAVQQVQNCVGTLRRLLSSTGVQADIARISASYRLITNGNQVDASQFVQILSDAETRARAGDLHHASASIRRALSLWSGKALEDVGSDALAPVAARFEEMRLRALEQCGKIDLAQGNNANVVVEFSEWVSRYPYHENLHGYLALAMHNMGRTADGLRVLQSLRSRLSTELGIEAGAFVDKVHRGLLDSQEANIPDPGGMPFDADVLQMVRSAVDQMTRAVALLSSQTCQTCSSSPSTPSSGRLRRASRAPADAA